MSTIKKPSKIPELNTKRLLLRKINLKDARDIFEYAQVKDATSHVPWDPHKSIQDSRAFIKFATEQFTAGSSIIWGIEVKKEKKLIGTIDLRGWRTTNNCGEIGYVISNKYWNMGFITEALKAVIKFGFEKLQLNRIESHCEEENIGSWHVMEKAGMKYEGTLREKIFMKEKYRSMKMYSILKKEYN